MSLGIVQWIGVDHARSSHRGWDATASFWFPPWGLYRGIESFFQKGEPKNVAEAIERIDHDDDPALGSSAAEVAYHGESSLAASALIRRSLRCRSPRRSACCSSVRPRCSSRDRVDLKSRSEYRILRVLLRIYLVQGRSCG